MLKPGWAITASLCSSLIVTSGWAREVIPTVGLKVEEHSNLRRVRDNPSEDTVINPYVGLEYEDATGDYVASIDAQIDFETYKEDEFSDKTFVEMDAYLDWIVQPGRFTWAVENYSDQYRINIQKPDTPDNIQNVNVFATGPDLLFTANAWELLVKGRLANVAYSKTDVDSSRFITAVSGNRAINPYSSFNIDTTLSVVDFNEDYLDDYNVITTGLRYNRELPYGKFHGAAGYNGFEFDSGKSKNDPYFDVNLQLDVGGASHFEFSGAHKLTDLALESFNPLYTRLLDDLEINNLFKQTTERGASGVYRVTRAFGSYTFKGPLFGASIFGFVNEQRYFNTQTQTDAILNDHDETGVGLSLSYELTEKLLVRGGVSVSDIEYVVEDLDVDWKAGELAAVYNFADNFFVVAGVAKEDSQSEIEDRDFENDRVYVQLEYKAEPKFID